MAVTRTRELWRAAQIAMMPLPVPTSATAIGSSADGRGSVSRPAPMRVRQVEQRPRPPHTEACGMPPMRLISSTLRPVGADTIRASP